MVKPWAGSQVLAVQFLILSLTYPMTLGKYLSPTVQQGTSAYAYVQSHELKHGRHILKYFLPGGGANLFSFILHLPYLCGPPIWR